VKAIATGTKNIAATMSNVRRPRARGSCIRTPCEG
jgi:hypothetical protein